ncbi:cation transporter [soil metagenome]
MPGLIEPLATVWIVAIFVFGAVVIGVAGSRLAKTADALADRTHMGEAVTGALFLGAATSLPGLVTSVTAAVNDLPVMAIDNALGGIAAQTAFLGIADIFHRRANLEHTAASLANLMQGGALIALLAMVLVAANVEIPTVGGVHLITPIMVVFYCYGLRLAASARAHPMWVAKQTGETQADDSEEESTEALRQSTTRLWCVFAGLGAACGLAGWAVASSGIVAIGRFGLSESVVGGIFTAVSSSLPELVTSIAAVRAGAYTLAVGGIIGGNAFDTLFVAASDVAYREGSIYSEAGTSATVLVAVSILMTAVLSMGLLRRERHGVANIGLESMSILVLYALTVWYLVAS